MATRFKASDLKEMIRALVREELKSSMKAAINEILSERYLRSIAEAAASRPRGVGRTMHIADGDDQDVEDTPQVLANTTQGIYGKHPMKHDDRIEDDEPEQKGPSITTIPEGVERDDMMSMFFEGTKSIDEIERDAGFMGEDGGDEGAPLPRMPATQRRAQGSQRSAARRPINEVWSELAGTNKPKPTASPEAVAAERQKFEEARLKRLRESLERKV